MSLLRRIPPLAWLCLALALWGAWGRVEEAKLRAEALEASQKASVEALWAGELARQQETRWNSKNMEIADALNQAQIARADAARSAADRLRKLAQARTEHAATEAALAACRSYGGPAVRVISDATREALVELATDADKVSAQLAGCQAYVRDVCLTD